MSTQTTSPATRAARFALDRLAYGPRPESLDDVLSRGIERWVEEQLEPRADGALETRLRGLPSLGSSVADNLRLLEVDPRAFAAAQLDFRTAHFIRAVHGRNQLEEVLTDFWFNHFNVYGGENLVRVGLARYEADAIRPHALGRFRDLLGAVAGSWAMMVYLDNYLSTARRINENYARELMELHTLGVDGGYAQSDVEQVARAFTGWGIERGGGRFLYRDGAHDQAPKRVLGTTLPANQGQKDGTDVLDLLARHPSTARFIALKLARRFVADDPPSAVVDAAAEAFTRSGGQVADVMRALLGAREFWAEAFLSGKVKTPHEYVVSALRAVGAEVTSARALLEGRRATDNLVAMGMPTYEALDPTGWSDRGGDWLPNPGSHLARLNFALALLSQTMDGVDVDLRRLIGGTDPGDAGAVADVVNERIFAGTLPPQTRAACARVGASGALAPAFKVVALCLASPAFQVR